MMRSVDLDPSAMRYIELQGVRENTESTSPDNSIISSKYTKLSFFPRALISQFFHPPMLWFLLISVLELTQPVQIALPYATLLPLCLLVLFGLAKDGYGDYQKHRSDDNINSQPQLVWNGYSFKSKKSKDILVGDIILLKNEETSPADMLVLAVGNEEHECYADVSAVIGESNLKVKHPIKETQNKIDSIDLKEASMFLTDLNEDLFVALPNKYFKHFHGKVKLTISPVATSIGSDYLLLRGTKITNTPWVFGIAVYTGIETKIWINNLIKTTKVSQLKKIMDRWMNWMFILVGIICFLNTVIFVSEGKEEYVWTDVLVGNIIIFGHIIPISLYISVELIRVYVTLKSWYSGQVKFHTSGLYSNLGMVEYIVTDKTGTLTENFLDVALFIINDKLYKVKENMQDPEDFEKEWSSSHLNPTGRANSINNFEFHSFTLLTSGFLLDPMNSKHLNFMTCLAICNLAFPANDDFIAISVDDKVLARTAARFGVKVTFRTADTCIIDVLGTEVVYDILGTQAFSSDIKKSRIIVRNTSDSTVTIFVKGNRESMVNIYDGSYQQLEIEDAMIEYRSLFLGYKSMTPKEVEEFIFDYETAQLSPVNKQGRVENVFRKVEKGIEFLGIVGLEDIIVEDTRDTVQALTQAGIKFWVVSGDSEESTLTASLTSRIFTVDNKIIRLVNYSSELDCMKGLQEHIKENIYPDSSIGRISIDSELNVNVQGVKSEMVIPASISVPSIDEIVPITVQRRKRSRHSTLLVRGLSRRSSIHPLVSKISGFNQRASLEGEYNPKSLKFILSVDSSALEYGTSSKEHLKYFTALLFTAKAVCFHSLLPDQKSKVVRLLKHNFRFSPLVMAIGDGISDIGMIKESDIGIGIEGKEGLEAAMSSDVAIKRFSELKHMVLINGHKQYIQVSKLVLLSFYAVFLLEAVILMYNPLTRWTSSSIIDEEFLMVYKLIINILPIVGLCVLDKDSSSTFITPKAYRAGMFNSLLTKRNLAVHALTAVFQAGFTFLCTQFYFSHSSMAGNPENSLLISCCVYLILSTTVFISVLAETYSISLKIVAVYFLCIAVEIIIIVPLSYVNSDLGGYIEFVLTCPSVWVYLVLTTLFNFSFCYLIKAIRYIFLPDILEKIRNAKPSSSFQLYSRIKQFKKTLKYVYRESSLWKHKSAYDDNAINYKTLKFFSRYREQIYQNDKLSENYVNFRVLLLIGGVSVNIYSVYALAYIRADTAAIVFHVASSILILLSYFLPSIPNFGSYSFVYLAITYIMIQVFYLVSQLAFRFDCLPMCTYLPVLYLIGFSNYWFEMTLLVISSNTISALICVFELLHKPTDLVAIDIITYCIVYLGICLTASLVAYEIDKSKRHEFVLVQKVQVEISKAKSVLSYLLPAFVTKRVQNRVSYISDYQGVVSVIFCDIYNFESILKHYNPAELTAFLDEVYAKFDQICLASGCTKIETVGKTYMACAGLKDSETELDPYYSGVVHARRCIEMGIAIIKNAEKIYLKNKEVLQFNIGINSGPVTAGVVGYHKPQFSLVGDTVNTASRMASLCPKPNTLQISAETYDLIGDRTGLVFESSQVDAKGKGLMKTFLVSVPEAQLASPSKVQAFSQSHSEKFTVKNAKSPKKTKKITLYQLSNLHSDNDRRRSSLLDDLEAEVANDDDYIKKETEVLEQVKWFSLSCTENTKERNFRLMINEATFPIALYGMILRVVVNLLLIVLVIVRMSYDEIEAYDELLRLVLEAVLVSGIIVKLKAYYQTSWYSWLISSICLIGAIFRFGSKLNSEVIFIQYIYHLFQAGHCSQLLFKNFIWIGVLIAVSNLIYLPTTFVRNWILQILANLIFFVILLFTIYTREQKLRYFTTIKSAAEKELKRTEELLMNMMPKNVFENLRENHSVTENILNVTILYADIVGFTKWSSDKLPSEVVNMLSELFTEFDKKCVKYEVYKVHTIGDCYVAMGYTGSKLRTENVECYRLAKFALALVDVIKAKNIENGTDLNMRIGMHTGDIIGGIAGTNIVRYDIYGTDVYIANKMESSGKSGRVKVSEATMKILSSDWPMTFIFEKDEDVYIPIRNCRVKTYFMENNPEEKADPLNESLSEG